MDRNGCPAWRLVSGSNRRHATNRCDEPGATITIGRWATSTIIAARKHGLKSRLATAMGWRRVVMTPEDKVSVRKRRHEGRSMSEIVPEIGKTPASVFDPLRRNGGIEPRARTRCPDALRAREAITCTFCRAAERVGPGARSGAWWRHATDEQRRSGALCGATPSGPALCASPAALPLARVAPLPLLTAPCGKSAEDRQNAQVVASRALTEHGSVPGSGATPTAPHRRGVIITSTRQGSVAA